MLENPTHDEAIAANGRLAAVIRRFATRHQTLVISKTQTPPKTAPSSQNARQSTLKAAKPLGCRRSPRVQELEWLARLRGKPRRIRIDNGPEFAGQSLDQVRAYLNKVEIDVSRPGKPGDNASIEVLKAAFGRNVSMLNGSCRRLTPAPGSTTGGSTITKTDHIRRSKT